MAGDAFQAKGGRTRPKPAASRLRPRVAGRFQPSGGADRLRWTTTLSREALARLDQLAETQGVPRNAVVELLIAGTPAAELAAAPLPPPAGDLPGRRSPLDVRQADPGEAEVVISCRATRRLRSAVAAAAQAAGIPASSWVRLQLARLVFS
jgi:hypothetical protein